MTPLLRSAARRASRKNLGFATPCVISRGSGPTVGWITPPKGESVQKRIVGPFAQPDTLVGNGVAEEAASGDVLHSVAHRAAQSCGGASGPSRTRTPGAKSMVVEMSDMRCPAGFQ